MCLLRVNRYDGGRSGDQREGQSDENNELLHVSWISSCCRSNHPP
jgi:hypothetical protein